ncbi:polysaccharide lyase family 26 protein [Aspergillus stella-maris]|uniref:polysaccharide lyase family 26 protein n=1 Tax=Aspergillus stella-maris TaxID=1810926 RepID=UPI003CCD504B
MVHLPSLKLLGALSLLPTALSLPGTSSTSSTNSSATSVPVSWLGSTPSYTSGTTFGLPWPKGKYTFNDTSFSIAGVPLQSWVNGYWADGSIKWSGHAVPSLGEEDIQDGFTVDIATGSGVGGKTRRATRASTNSTGSGSLTVSRSGGKVEVNTGKITVLFPRSGSSLVESITTASGQIVGQNGKLVLHSQDSVAEDVASRPNSSVTYSNFESKIGNVTVSKQGDVRALVTVTGTHAPIGETEHEAWLQFVVRFYLYADSDAIRIVHSFVFDGDASSNFVSGLGIRFDVPLEGEELYNRHVRVPGEEGGFLHEAVKGITGLRRDPGEEVRTAQVAGQVLPAEDTWDTRVTTRLHWIPNWNDYKLSQLSPDGFTIAKRTKAGQGWIHIPGGTRSHGLTYLGGATKGGLALGLRDFWKRFPTGVEISNAAGDTGSLTLWLYSPDAAPLDLRPFHNGLGEDTYEEQLDALEITYEDYEPGFNTPYGIARTSELYLYAFDSTPESSYLATLSNNTNNPPVLLPSASYIHETKALGSYWNLPSTSSTGSKSETLESNLDFLIQFYIDQVADRKWYGFLDYGDYMHTYDEDRHIWRYDVGGYAWDNSELSPDLFLWQQFLRTGSENVYRLAEALTRHTGEVDVYHIGDWKGLGTRHGVQHYADSAKQVRITQPQYRKYFFYLSGGDERVGEILEEALDTDKTYEVLDPNRKVRTDGWTPTPGQPATISLGTDWAGLAAGWLIEWERRGSRWIEARDKLTNTAKGIANLTNGFVTGSGLYSVQDGTLTPPPADTNNTGLVSVSHLNSVFGLPEVLDELFTYWGESGTPAGFKEAWLDYTYYYSASSAEQESRYGESFGSLNLIQGHSRLTAYYASQTDNSTVGLRAWDEFYNNNDGILADESWASEIVDGDDVLIPVHEADFVSTNAFAQYGLAAIQNLALVGGVLEDSPYP